VPDVAEELMRVEQARARLGMRLSALLSREIDRIGHLRARPALAEAGWIVDRRAEDLTRWVARGTELIERCIEKQTARVGELRGHLRALSPQATLDRGYAIVQGPDRHVLRAPAGAPEGATLTLTLAEGVIGAVSTGAASHDLREPAPSTGGAGRSTGASGRDGGVGDAE
jgi:exodeoxyribonuclease VII large subunit